MRKKVKSLLFCRFSHLANSDNTEIYYYVNENSKESQGSIDFRKVTDISQRVPEDNADKDPEIHITIKSGRVYILKPMKGSERDLRQILALLNLWLSFLRQKPLPVLPKTQRASVPSLGLERGHSTHSHSKSSPGREEKHSPKVRKMRHCLLSFTSFVLFAHVLLLKHKIESPRVNGKNSESPRKLNTNVASLPSVVMTAARDRFATVSGRRPLETLERESEASCEMAVDTEEQRQGFLKFSLLQNFAVKFDLFFDLAEGYLIGYADPNKTEVVEKIALSSIDNVVSMDNEGNHFVFRCTFSLLTCFLVVSDSPQFKIRVNSKEGPVYNYFQCPSHSERDKWISGLRLSLVCLFFLIVLSQR